MKKILYILLVTSLAYSSEAQNRLFGNGFYNVNTNKFGWLSTTDSIAYLDSLKLKMFKPLMLGSFTTAGAPTASNFPGAMIYNADSAKPQYSNGSSWVTVGAGGGGGGGGVTVVGTINSQTKDANGLVISGANIYAQTADASNPGLVSTGTQTFAGTKTLTGSVGVGAAPDAAYKFDVTGGNTRLSIFDAGDNYGELITAKSSSTLIVRLQRILSGGPLQYDFGSGTAYWQFDNGSGEVRHFIPSGGYFATFYGNGSEVMRLSTGGNMLVGSTSDDGVAKLQVTGKTHLTDTVRADARISYSGNYHASFTPFSLVTKKYTDSVVAAGGGNAITSYTPTITSVTNVASTTLKGARYRSDGAYVEVWVYVTVDPTSTGSTEIAVSLPVASEIGANELFGSGSCNVAAQSGIVTTDATNNRATFIFSSTDTGAQDHVLIFTYPIVLP